MNEEEGFRAKLREDPECQVTWDAYRDWLMDRDDVRAEAISLLRFVDVDYFEGYPLPRTIWSASSMPMAWPYNPKTGKHWWWELLSAPFRCPEYVDYTTESDALFALVDAWPSVAQEHRTATLEWVANQVTAR